MATGAASTQSRPARSVVSPNAQAPAWLRTLLDSIDLLGRVGGIVAAISLAALCLLITGEIIIRLLSRYLAYLPPGIPSAWEISSFLMGASFICGSAMTLRVGGHIRVALLTASMPAAARRALEIVVSMVGFAVAAFLAYSLAQFTMASFLRGQTSISSDIPLWIPKLVLTVGAVLLSLQMLARLAQAALGLPLEDANLKPRVPGQQ